MKKALFIAIFGGCVWLCYTALNPTLPSEKHPLLFYSNQLRDDLKRVVVSAIEKAQSSLTIQIYGLTDPDVLNALTKAIKRGIEVTLFYDPSGSKNLSFGHPVKSSGLMHRKILVADGKITLVGSANFTTQSLKMHSNLVIGLYGEKMADHFGKAIQDSCDFWVDGAHCISFFLPDFQGIALDELCRRIKKASHSINLAMFTLTHPKLVQELCDALARGVSVQVAIDSNTQKGASKEAISKLKSNGATILVGFGKQLLHHKCALIDKEVFVVGSANWTEAAFSKNQDCLLIFDDLSLAHRKKLAKLWDAVAITSEKK